jgi:hypothetical protein
MSDRQGLAESVVDEILSRHGLCWELHPYRIVVDNRPGLLVQAGPIFDLRESVLKGARLRALAAERKRRQRTRTPKMSRSDGPTEEYNPSIRGHLAILDVQSHAEVENDHGQSSNATSDGI